MFRSQKRYITLNSVFIVLALFNFVFFNTEIRDLQSSSERLVNSSISLMCACGSALILFLAFKKKTILLKRFLLANLFLTGAPLIYQVFSMFLFGLGYFYAGGQLAIAYLVYPLALIMIFIYIHLSLLKDTNKKTSS